MTILLLEYLLADASIWQQASDSMRREALMMLTALVEDVALVDGFPPTVLLSPVAAEFLEATSRLPQPCRVLLCESGPIDWLKNPAISPTTFAATLAIAPESSGLLVDVLKTLQGTLWSSVRNLNLHWSLAEIFTDKFATFRWLQNNGFSTPETKTLCDAAVDLLCVDAAGWRNKICADATDLSHFRNAAIIKPRDGAGCGDISLIPMTLKRFDRLSIGRFTDDRWIIQRVLRGAACSIGLLGGGAANPALVLPPAQQCLAMHNGQLIYTGGEIPCDSRLGEIVTKTGEQLAAALGPFSGYVGADIVVTESDRGQQTAHVIEINPRLCTSYVGYRQHCTSNLMDVVLLGDASRLGWKQEIFRFTT